MRKKGSVPVTILVIGVFALCSLAMFTFFVSDFKITNVFVGLGIVENVNSQVDSYDFYKRSGVSEEDLSFVYDIQEMDSKRYIYEELTYEEFSFFGKNKEVVLFSIYTPVD